MVNRSSRDQLLSMLNCVLSTGEDWHICKDPIQLKCEHYICRTCLLSDSHKVIKCNLCSEYNNQCDLNEISGAKMFQRILKFHLNDIYNILYEDFEDEIKYFDNNASLDEQGFYLRIECIKSDIDTRIGSLIDQLENVRKDNYEKLDKIKADWVKKHDQLRIEEFINEYEILKANIITRHNLTESNLYDLQNKLKELKYLHKNFQNGIPIIDFQKEKNHINRDFVGNLLVNGMEYDNVIHEQAISRLISSDFELIDLPMDLRPYDMCVVPDNKTGNKLLFCDYDNSVLFLYNKDLSLVKTITKINGKSYNIISLDTNKMNAIYLCAIEQNVIIKTDLNLNEIAVFGNGRGCGLDQLDTPSGICFANQKIYVCDFNNQRIQKFNEDLKLEKSFQLDYHPWSIKIINNIACVREPSQTIYFYNAYNFNESKQYFAHGGIIGASQSHFYEYNNENKRLYCYTKYGHLLDEIKEDCLPDFHTIGSICLFKCKLIMCNPTCLVTI